MSNALEVRAEVLKIARLFGRAPAELHYLEQLSAAELRDLREQVTEALFGSQGSALARLAAASRLLPVALVAQLAERAFGPVLSARVAGLIEADRAVEMAAKLPIPFLADIAVELDPRRAQDVIARIPSSQIAAITRELTRRREYVAMGRFVGHLPDDSIRAAIGAMDAVTLLNVSLVLENKEKLPEVIGLLEPGRFEEMVALAAASELADELRELLDYLSDAQRALALSLPELQRLREAS
jgi:hypothetical protein